MDVPSVQELEAMRYSELQTLAKGAGLRANHKADKLLKALMKHFHQEANTENVSEDSDGSSTLTDTDELNSSQDKEETAPVSHVTNRRGRGQKAIQREATPKLENANNIERGTEAPSPEKEQGYSGKAKDGGKSSLPSSGSMQRKRRWTEDETSGKTALETAKRQPQSSSDTRAPQSGKIPRYAGRLSKPGNAQSKSTTPNFKKMHEAHFKKMESIDKYMERKQRRLDAVCSSIQEVKMLAKKSRLLQKTPVSNSKEPLSINRMSLLSPAPRMVGMSPTKTPANRRRSTRGSTANKSILADKAGFKPSCFSSSNMNVRFAETTKDNEQKRVLTKTPVRKRSLFGTLTPGSEQRSSIPVIRKSGVKPANPQPAAGDSNQLAITPFKFTAENPETPNTNKKSKFNLQASLARPLGYQPHTGKLKPWGDQENKSASKSNVSVLKEHYKQSQLKTREDRREEQVVGRKNKRDQTLGTRRGVAIL
ncbi:hypothetical protein FKM82_016437 [Ascaphus truei]